MNWRRSLCVWYGRGWRVSWRGNQCGVWSIGVVDVQLALSPTASVCAVGVVNQRGQSWLVWSNGAVSQRGVWSVCGWVWLIGVGAVSLRGVWGVWWWWSVGAV